MEAVKKFVKTKGFLAFILGFLLYIVIFLPDLIINKGILYGSGDYNIQTVTYFFHIRECILEGKDLLWDSSSGLGGQFLSLYSQNIFTPFSLIFLLVPYSAMPYAIFYVTALKSAVASLTAYFYIRRYVTNSHYAVIGGLLYAFSSFSAWNLVYNFMDVISLFPLLLLALDELCINNRKVVFALAVMLLAYTNYFFFFGIAVFCIIYYFIRCTDKNYGLRYRKLPVVALEAVIGCGMAMITIIPLLITLSSYGRAGSLIQPENMLLYDDIFDYLKIIQSAFMVPDPFAFVSLFPEKETAYPYGNIFASVAAFIPLFSASGVISYVVARRKTWQSYLIAACTVIAFIPVLNQMFFGFNSSYYARWYFMVMLICVMVSVKALEEQISFKPGIIVSVGVFAALLIYQIFSDSVWITDSSVPAATTSVPQNILHFAVTALSLIMLILLVKTKRDKEFIPKLYVFTIAGCYTVFGIMAYYFLTGSGYMDKNNLISVYNYNTEIPGEIEKDKRISLSKGATNYNLVWGLDSTSCFNSIYDAGFAEFMNDTGLVYNNGRYMSIDPEMTELNDLFSVRYYYQLGEPRIDNITPVADFGIGKFYENGNYIPMGFTYDTMISADKYASIEDPDHKMRVYMKHLVVENPDEFSDLLTLCDENVLDEISEEEYAQLISRHKSESCYEFEKNNSGFSAKIDMSRENVVFFSVSFNDSWKAYIDGAESEVYKVNNGMIGVRVPEGRHEISLEYSVKGLTGSVVISVVSAAALVVYAIICKRKDKKQCP